MLELRPCCENCGKDLPPAATDAFICSFECTFCQECTEAILHGICPNCRGELQRRPIRPEHLLSKYPSSDKRIFKPRST